MMSAFATALLLAATGLALPDADVCNGQGQDSCDSGPSDDPSLLSHQIRRMRAGSHGNCDVPDGSGDTCSALKYADIHGFDLENHQMQGKEDWDKCCQKCSENPACHAWTFHWDQKRCYLKSNPPF